MTRQYHNLLQKEEGGNTQSYLWDGNVAGMREDRETASHYYLQDELGSPIRLMDKNGKLTESYGYDEFGQELYGNREGTVGRSLTKSIQPFGYTGYQYDKTAGTYYAQAREYRAEQGRFAAVDTIKGFAAAPYTLNEYGYCWNNPMALVDLDGQEAIVVTGGNYNHTDYNGNEGFKYNFVETSIREIKQIQADNPDENITWIVADEGYSNTDKAVMDRLANKLGVDVKYIKNTDELIEYVNYKTEPDSPGSSMGEEREDDKITKISFFSHGMYDGTIDLAYKYSDNLKITRSMIKDFDATAFDNPETFFGSCNAGTNQQSENDAYAQLWVNHIGGTAVAVNGKTDYSNINVGDKNWRYYLGAVRRKLGLFNTYGSLNGPTPSGEAFWINFCPLD